MFLDQPFHPEGTSSQRLSLCPRPRLGATFFFIPEFPKGSFGPDSSGRTQKINPLFFRPPFRNLNYQIMTHFPSSLVARGWRLAAQIMELHFLIILERNCEAARARSRSIGTEFPMGSFDPEWVGRPRLIGADSSGRTQKINPLFFRPPFRNLNYQNMPHFPSSLVASRLWLAASSSMELHFLIIPEFRFNSLPILSTSRCQIATLEFHRIH